MNVKRQWRGLEAASFVTSAFPLSSFVFQRTGLHAVVLSGLELLGTGNIPGSAP